eukprot:3294495-Pyramimonas_sp.AAC.1
MWTPTSHQRKKAVPTRCHTDRGIQTGTALNACEWNACGAHIPRPKGQTRLNVALRVEQTNTERARRLREARRVRERP